jgi:long-subunit fatty acid transport protein
MRKITLVCVLTLCALLSAVERAAAGGLEYAGQGAQSLGRGGAVTARADDPMVLAHNPAGLVELRGSQFLLNLNVAFLDACVDPAGYYGWGTYLGGNESRLVDPETGQATDIPLTKVDRTTMPPTTLAQGYYVDPYDTVCLDQNITPIPQLAWTRRISEDFGIGFGFIFPSVQPSGRWGGANGIIQGKNGELRPAPTRYMMLSSNNLGLFPNLGAAYKFADAFRLGLALEWGMIGVNNFTMAAAVGGTSPANDIVAHVKAQDWFIPAFTVSAHVVPLDAIDAVVAFRFQDDIDATGDVDLTTGLFDPTLRKGGTGGIPITSLVQHMPWKLRVGLRYADRFAPRPVGTGRWEADASTPHVVHDPLQDERWDIEADVEYQFNSRNDAQVVNYGSGKLVEFQAADPTRPPATTEFPNADVPYTIIEKNWKDQISARLGGTLTLLPGVAGVSAGAHYETRGIDPDYMQIDFWPVERLGLHAGVILRVAKSIDFVVSYAHIFQETIVVAPPAHKARDVIDDERAMTADKIPVNVDKTVGALQDRAGNGQMVLEEVSQGKADGVARLDQNTSRNAGDQPPYIVNAGRYRSNFDIISAGVNVHF